LYWKFVLIDKRSKIASGERTTSFSFLLNDKRGAIGKALGAVNPGNREMFFMFGQLGTCSFSDKIIKVYHVANVVHAFKVYSVATELPALFLLYDSPLWSSAFLLLIFSVSVWNGGGFYIEVFGRK